MCLFIYLVKATLWLLGVFFPIISLLLHIGLMTIWAYGIHVQTAPDTIDPNRINRGAPWYITKSCNIVEDKYVKSYCMQAKSAFAVSIMMLYVPSSLLPYAQDIDLYPESYMYSSSFCPRTPWSPLRLRDWPTKPSEPRRKPRRRSGLLTRMRTI